MGKESAKLIKELIIILDTAHEMKNVIAISINITVNKGSLNFLSASLSGAKTKNKKYAMTKGTNMLDNSLSTKPITARPIAIIKNLVPEPR